MYWFAKAFPRAITQSASWVTSSDSARNCIREQWLEITSLISQINKYLIALYLGFKETSAQKEVFISFSLVE